jgi:hypothetical protein
MRLEALRGLLVVTTGRAYFAFPVPEVGLPVDAELGFHVLRGARGDGDWPGPPMGRQVLSCHGRIRASSGALRFLSNARDALRPAP